MRTSTKLVLGTATTLLATSALTVSPVSTPTAAAAGCTFEVRKAVAPVRENPSSRSVIRRYKHIWDRVTGPCSGPVIRDPHNRYQYFRPVYSASCTDGVGWMATQTLRRV